MLPMTEYELAPGVKLRAIQTKKFKTSLLSATFLAPLSEKTASLNALLPHVLRRGTKTCPDMEALSAALDELYGGGIEPIIRKKSEVHCIGFVGSFLDDAFVPDGFPILEKAASLLGELILSPAEEGNGFIPAYVESEKANLIDRIRSQMNDKRQYAALRLLQQMCDGEAFGVDKNGSEETASAVTGKALYEHYRTLLETAPLYLYYCGSAEPERVEKAFREAFAALPRTSRRPIPDSVALKQPKGELRRFEDYMDVTQGKLVMGFRLGGSVKEKEHLARTMLFNSVYGGGTNSKLFLQVREKLSLCYYVSASSTMSKGVMMVSSGVDFAHFAQAEEEILAQLDACRQGDFTQEDMDAARRSLVSSLRSSLDAQGRLEEYWLSRFVTKTDFAPEELVEALQAVTREDIVKIAGEVSLDSIYHLSRKEA